jgi:hypothetical protein
LKTVDRIALFIEHQGISQNAFDVSIGRPKGYIGKQSRSKASIGSDILETILRTYENLNPQWLISGEGEMIKGSKKESEVKESGSKYNQDPFENILLQYLDRPKIKEKIKNLLND